jgi:plastocyanin
MSETMSPRRALALMLALSLIALVALSLACSSGGDDNGDDGDGGETPTATQPSGDGGGEEVTIDVSMGDNFYEPNELTVPAGASVTINLSNDGTAIHNMRVAGEDNAFNTDDDTVSDPDLFNAGDTGTLEWTAPSEPGVIDFQCDFHTTDMSGKITVE